MHVKTSFQHVTYSGVFNFLALICPKQSSHKSGILVLVSPDVSKLRISLHVESQQGSCQLAEANTFSPPLRNNQRVKLTV